MQRDSILKEFINFTEPENTRKDTHETRKTLEMSKTQLFGKCRKLFPSGKSLIMPKNQKGHP